MRDPWPYLSDRLEFIAQGLGDKQYVMAFLKVEGKGSSGERIHQAKCVLCGATIHHGIQVLWGHGDLHVAIESISPKYPECHMENVRSLWIAQRSAAV